MDPTQLRSLFPITEQCVYLNHASVGALSQPVVEAMNRYLAERLHAGSEALVNWDDRLEGIRQTAARFIGAHRDEIVFTDSISHGLNIVASGLDWQPGYNLICAQGEFVANVYPWTNLRRRGVEVRFAPTRDNRIPVEDVSALMNDRTRLVAISYVEFGTGYRNDLDTLAALCHERGAYLSVDSIQGLGALQLSVQQTPVDFLAAHGAKWMLGPIGAGFLYIRRDLLPMLDPVMTGWRSVVDRKDYFRYDSPLRDTGERFEPGSPNHVGLIGLEATMELLMSVGLAEIENRIFSLTDMVIDGLQARGCTITTPIAHRGERSGIICFRHPTMGSDEVADRLNDAGIIVSVRGGAVRVSPHFYNTEEELERLLEVLPNP